MSTRPADYAVLIGTCCASLLAGIWAGETETRAKFITNCEPQPGHTLYATRQEKDKVTCFYAQHFTGYGRAIRVGKATKP